MKRIVLIAFTVFGVAATFLLAGCTIHRTPDGHGLWSGSGPSSVQSELGPPDLIETLEHQYHSLGYNDFTWFTYLDRGYKVKFIDNWVRGVRVLTEEERPSLIRRSKAFREQVPLIKLDATSIDVLRTYGPPQYVFVGFYGKEEPCYTKVGLYEGELEHPPEYIAAYWHIRDIVVVLKNGRVQKVEPISDSDRNMIFSNWPQQ